MGQGKSLDSQVEIANKAAAQTSESILCGPDCQRQKKEEQLLQSYNNAKVNAATAPNQLYQAEKQYYTYSSGPQGYREIVESQSSAEATQLRTTLTNDFNSKYTNAMQIVNTYKTLYESYINTYTLLHEKYIHDNTKLSYQNKKEISDTMTNDRKSFYENQGNDNLGWWYRLFYWIYIIALVILIITIILGDIQWTTLKKTSIVVLFIFFPIISNFIVMKVIYLFQYMYSVLPKNTNLS